MATVCIPREFGFPSEQEYSAYLEYETSDYIPEETTYMDSMSEAPEECVEDPETGQLLFSGMRLEDYEPIKAVGPRPVYYGPKPRPYGTMMWSHGKEAWYYLDEGIHSLDHLDTKALNDKQREIRRVYEQYQAMRNMQHRLDDMWYAAREPHKDRFYQIMDSLARECYYCEHAHHAHEGGSKREYCECENEYEQDDSDQEW
jgi:hypothetical protein